MRRPLIDPYRRTYGLSRSIQNNNAALKALQRSTREGDITQIIHNHGGGGSGSATGIDTLQEAYNGDEAILVVGGTPIFISIASLGNALHLGDNAQLFFGTGADAGFWYDGTDFVLHTNVVGSGDFELWGGRQLQGYAGSGTGQTWVIDNATARVGLGTGASSSPWIIINLSNPSADRDKQQILGIRSTTTSAYTGTADVGIAYCFKATGNHEATVPIAILAAMDWDMVHASDQDIAYMWGLHGYPQSSSFGTGAIGEAGAVVLQGTESGNGDVWEGGVEPDEMYGLLVETLDFQQNTSIFRGVDIRKQTGMASAVSFRGGDAIVADDQAEVRFEEATANGDNYVGFKAPASIGSNLIWALPSADGAANTRLKTDGSATLAFQQETEEIKIEFNNGASDITTGVKADHVCEYAGTITGWTILGETTSGDASGSIVLDVWKDTYANFPPTVADTIAGSEKPTISAALKGQDLSLSTWTTALAQGDILRINVDSCTDIKRVTLSLRVNKT